MGSSSSVNSPRARGSANLGHRHPRILAAFEEALRLHDHMVIFPTDAAERLAARLVEVTGFGSGACYFTVGGSQAIEIATRIARIYARRPGIAHLDLGFHGLGGETVHLSRGFVPLATLDVLPERPQIIELPFDAPEAFEVLSRYANRIGCLVFEPILGAAGFLEPRRAWLAEILRLTRRLGIVTICDEIQVGLGRTGRMLAVEDFIDPAGLVAGVDIVVLSKSLAGGLYPLSAIVLNGRTLEIHRRLETLVPLGESFSTSPTGAAAALEVLDLLEEDQGRILTSTRERGRRLLDRLEAALVPGSGALTGVRGRGLASALDFADRHLAHRFVEECFRRGLLLYVCGGRLRSSVKLIPPLTITDEDLDRTVEALAAARQTLDGTPGPDPGGRLDSAPATGS